MEVCDRSVRFTNRETQAQKVQVPASFFLPQAGLSPSQPESSLVPITGVSSGAPAQLGQQPARRPARLDGARPAPARGPSRRRLPRPGRRRRERGEGERARPCTASQAPAGEGGGGEPSWHKETLLKTENRRTKYYKQECRLVAKQN